MSFAYAYEEDSERPTNTWLQSAKGNYYHVTDDGYVMVAYQQKNGNWSGLVVPENNDGSQKPAFLPCPYRTPTSAMAETELLLEAVRDVGFVNAATEYGERSL
jgi:hypothetical protein